ncbi:hypothetical protein E2C01_001882 [Portunus trituberculatus]|uniref:Uncharacterized protein n=1 Tax=Portunus trituberculatus TaxID=210409 RepID=A0A5B7CLI8_PORTR|nr:hypothetical protein [Portunus trituberculatus]
MDPWDLSPVTGSCPALSFSRVSKLSSTMDVVDIGTEPLDRTDDTPTQKAENAVVEQATSNKT